MEDYITNIPFEGTGPTYEAAIRNAKINDNKFFLEVLNFSKGKRFTIVILYNMARKIVKLTYFIYIICLM